MCPSRIDQHGLRRRVIARLAFRFWRADVLQVPRSDQSFSIGGMASFLGFCRLNVHKTCDCQKHDPCAITQSFHFDSSWRLPSNAPPAVHETLDSEPFKLDL